MTSAGNCQSTTLSHMLHVPRRTDQAHIDGSNHDTPGLMFYVLFSGVGRRLYTAFVIQHEAFS